MKSERKAEESDNKYLTPLELALGWVILALVVWISTFILWALSH